MKNKKLRLAIQIIILALITFLGVLHQKVGGGVDGSPSVDALCAFGGLETLFSYLKTGTLIKRIEMSALVLFGALIISGIFFGRAFCGFVCPLGTLQELMNKLGKRLGIKKRELPSNIHRYAVYLKYVVLAAVVGFTWYEGQLIIRSYDPWASYMHISGGYEAILEAPWGFIILALVLVGAMYIDRFFCKYVCPLGAFMSVFNKISIFKITRKPSCINCSKCSKECPMNIDVKSENSINNGECTMCTQCVSSCPVNNTLVIENIPGKSKKQLTVSSTIIAVSLIFIITVGTAKTLGIFETASPTNQVLQNNATGQADPDNIKGYMTLNDISKSFNIPLDKLYTEFKLPKDVSPDMPLKDIKTKVPEFSPDNARIVVKTILGK